jgi:DNA ligase-1
MMYNSTISPPDHIMQNFVDVITACQNAGGHGKKAAIQAALSCANEDTRSLIWHALNPYLTFGVRKWVRLSTNEKMGYAGANTFLDLLQALSSRSLTGNAASQAVANTLALYTKEVADLLELVIEKDLKAGFSEETFNKVWAGKDDLWGTIPVFSVMLADKCEDTDDFEQYVTFPCQADHKYDGQRNIAFVRRESDVENRARSGKPSDHLNGLFDEDAHLLRAYLCTKYGPEWESIVIDGEAFASDFTETINAKKDGNDEAKKNLRFRVFFVMPVNHWLNQKTTITMRENRERLAEAFAAIKTTKLSLSEGREVKDYADMTAFCNEVIDVHKQEGLILKDWEAVYAWDRTFAWTKVKRFYDVDARMVGFYPGRPKSRLADTVGGANCVAFLESGERVEFNVGSGFSDDQRADMKANPDKWLAATHVIKYQDVSRSKSKKVASLRFCTYEHSRDDKRVEI